MKLLFNYLSILAICLLIFSCGGPSGDETDSSNEENTSQNDESSEDSQDSEDNGKEEESDEEETNNTDEEISINVEEGKAIPYQELQKFLPSSPKGFKSEEEAEGATINSGGFSYSQVSQTYKKGEDELEINLGDYSQAVPIFQSLTMTWKTGMSIDTNEQKAGVTSIGDGKFKGWEIFNKEDKSAELVLGISERFYLVVKAENQENTDLVKEIAESMNLEKLASL